MKRALLIAGLLVSLLHSSIASAQDVRTEWAPIAKSLTVLLNEGWRITSHTHTEDSTSPTIFTFVLAKADKVVICLIAKPQPNNAASRCRALN